MKKFLLLGGSLLLLAALLSLIPGVQAAPTPTQSLHSPNAPTTAIGGGEWGIIWQGEGSVHDFFCPTDDICFAVGSGGVILKTEDRGHTWHQEIMAEKPILRGIDAYGDSVLAVGQSGAVYRSDNLGLSWTKIATPTGADLASVSLLSDGNAWAVGEGGVIIHSTDGGYTWQAQTSNTAHTLHAVEFLDANTGYAAGEKGTLLKTSDGGSTWTPIATTFPGWARINTLSFIDANSGWIAGQAGYIRMTSDGGSSWQDVNSGVGVDIFSIHVQEGFGIFGGARGSIATSNDGINWTLRAAVSQDERDVTAVFSLGAGNVWAAGVQKEGSARAWFIDHSSDSIHFDAVAGDYGAHPVLQEIAMPGKDVAYVVGHDGAIGKTTDGGETWAWQHFTSKYSGPARIAAISCPTVDDCWIAGQVPNNPGFVYATHDGGQTWAFQQLSNGSNWPWLYDVEMLDVTNGHIAANPDMFYTNDGTTWLKSSVIGSTANVEIAMASLYEGWTAQRQLGRRYTTSGGKIWNRLMPYSEQAGIYFFGVDTLDVNQDGGLDMGWMVGCQGPLVHEQCPDKSGVVFYAVGNQDPGQSQALPADTPPLYTIDMLDDLHGWIGGAEGTLLYTDSGGAKWQSAESPTTSLLTEISFFHNKIGFATTYSGEILRFRGPGRNLNSFTQTTAITVDGEIYDWHYGGALYLDAENASTVLGDKPYPNPAQLSGEFYSRWRNDTLYIMAQIHDDIIGPGDAVRLALDGLNDDVWSQQNDDDLLILIAANGEFDAGSSAADTAIAHAVKHTDFGWQLEMGIPAHLLGRSALAQNEAVGMNLMLDDSDGPGVGHSLLLSGRNLTAAAATWGDIRLLGNNIVLQNGLNEYDGTDDAFITIWGENGTINHGGDDILQTIFTSGRHYSNTLVRFNLATLPDRADANNAVLEMYAPATYARDGFQVAAYRLLRPWDEATTTWIMADATTPWAQGGALKAGEDYEPTPLDTVSIPTNFHNEWLSWNINEAVSYWQQHPDENYGIILMGVSSSQKLQTYSSEYNGAPQLRPKLVVDFSLQPRPTPTPTATPTITPTPTTTPTPTPQGLYLPLIQIAP